MEVPIPAHVRALLLYLTAQTVAVCVIFLMLAGFFAQWEGHVVGLRPVAGDAAKVYLVLIVDAEGNTVERNMSALAVGELGLPVNDLGIAPRDLPANAAATKKSRFQLSYLLQRPGADGEVGLWQSYPTTTPQALGVSVLLWFLGLGLRNMVYAGSPLNLEKRAVTLPKGQAQAGVAAQRGKSRSRKTVPNRRPSRGPRR